MAVISALRLSTTATITARRTAPITAPIVDLRPRLPWSRRLPARLGTAGLWLGGGCLLGPAKLAALLLAGTLVAPCLERLERCRPSSAPTARVSGGLTPLAEGGAGVPRSELAAAMALPESLLFRARHAGSCTVHHDQEGRIVGLELPAPARTRPLSLPSPDAHPVG